MEKNETERVEESEGDHNDIPNLVEVNFPEFEHFKNAIQEDIEALEKNNTWTITTLPLGEKENGFKYVLKVKRSKDGVISWNKAMLCTKVWSGLYRNLFIIDLIYLSTCCPAR